MAQGRAKEAVPLLDGRPPERAVSPEITAGYLVNRAYACVLLGEYDDAKRRFDEAARFASAHGLATAAIEITMRRGVLFTRLEDEKGAERCFREAREMAARQHDSYLEASAIGNLGYRLLNASRYDEAAPYFEQAGALAHKAGARRIEAMALGNLGRCHYGLGDYERAAKFLSSAEALAAGTAADLVPQIFVGLLGDVYSAQGELQKAASQYQRALAVSRRIGDKFYALQWLCSLADLALKTGDIEAAARYGAEALELGRSAGAPGWETWPRLIAARIAAERRDAGAAERGYREVIATGAEPLNRWAAQAGLGNLYAGQHRWREADSAWRDALATIETARSALDRDEWKLTFHASSIEVYRNYIDFLMMRNQVEPALAMAEFARARVLAQKLGIEQRVVAPVPASRFRALARAYRAGLVSYWLAPERSFVWVVTERSVRAFTLPGEEELKRLIDNYQSVVQALRDPLAAESPAARLLSDILLDPIRKSLPAGSRIVLVPDGPLHDFNLEMLPVDQPNRHYWIEDATVAVAPSLAVLEPPAPAEAGRAALLIGAPVPPGNEYPPLPEVEKELAGIRAKLSGWEQAVYTGASAQPAVYRESRPARFAVIHFAAHATANRQDPLESAVILSPQGGAYKLYAREIAAVPVTARLVTISACRGAGSRAYSGEGLVGLAWAFLQAGAKNVIAGLWEANDSSTAVLMDALYEQLAAGRPPAEALREAKLRLLRSGSGWAKPYYWAPFETLSRSGPF